MALPEFRQMLRPLEEPGEREILADRVLGVEIDRTNPSLCFGQMLQSVRIETVWVDSVSLRLCEKVRHSFEMPEQCPPQPRDIHVHDDSRLAYPPSGSVLKRRKCID